MQLKTLSISLALTFAAFPALSAEQKINLSVPGMTCASCPFIVEAAISGVDGVQSVETSLESRTAQVVFDDAITTSDEITLATQAVGYESSLLIDDSNS